MAAAEPSTRQTRLQARVTSLEAQLQSLLTALQPQLLLDTLHSEVVAELCKALERSLVERHRDVSEHLQRVKTELARTNAVDSAAEVPSPSEELLDQIAAVDREVDGWYESYVKLLVVRAKMAYRPALNTDETLGQAWSNVNRLLHDNLRDLLEYKQQLVARWEALAGQAYGSSAKVASDS